MQAILETKTKKERLDNSGAGHHSAEARATRKIPTKKAEPRKASQRSNGGKASNIAHISSGKFTVGRITRRVAKRPERMKKMRAARRNSAVIVTENRTSIRQFPIFAVILTVVITAVFMYMLSLYVKLDDYNAEISDMKDQIAEYNEEATVLEVSIENKFNLDMVEKAATEEYGMVSADSLPKTYLSVSEDEVSGRVNASDEKDGISSIVSDVAESLNID